MTGTGEKSGGDEDDSGERGKERWENLIPREGTSTCVCPTLGRACGLMFNLYKYGTCLWDATGIGAQTTQSQHPQSENSGKGVHEETALDS